MNKHWKAIENYPDYQLSDQGRVRSFKDKSGAVRYLGLTMDKDGYLQVNLCGNGEVRTCKVHQLVLAAFLGPCPKGMEANHLDVNKRNNRLDNLEYTTHSENMKHAYHLGLGNIKAVIQRSMVGQFVADYISQCEASRRTGVNQGHISECCNGKIKSAGGFVWEHSEELV